MSEIAVKVCNIRMYKVLTRITSLDQLGYPTLINQVLKMLTRTLWLTFAAVITAPSCCLAQNNSPESPFVVASQSFTSILGAHPRITVIFNTTLPLFHEAGIYHPPSDSLFAVSDTINDPSIENNQTTQILVHIANISTSTPKYTILTNISLSHPTSGARYLYGGVDLIAILAAGNEQDSPPGGLYLLNPYPPFNVTPLTTSYGDYPYNSPNDLTVFPDGSIYFTDPVYGFENGLRGPPSLPNQIYRYDPVKNTTRVIADGFGRPNGIAHSPDGGVLYISDTGASVGNGSIDSQGPRSTYAFSIRKLPSGAGGMAGPFATDRRVFAMPDVSANDGLKTDTQGNVYGQTAGGMQVWNPSGELLGKIIYEDDDGGNFGFAKPGVMYLMGATVLYRLEIAKTVVGTGVFRGDKP